MALWSDVEHQRAGVAWRKKTKQNKPIFLNINNALDLHPPQNHTHTNTHSLWRLQAWSASVYSFSTWRYKTKVVHSGNGATRSTIGSAGRPLCCHLHAWTAVNDRHTARCLCQSISPRPENCQKLLAAALITVYSLNCLSASFMNTACVPCVQLPESIWMYWGPAYESNHKVYIPE